MKQWKTSPKEEFSVKYFSNFFFFFLVYTCLTHYFLFQGTIQRCKEMHSQADRTDIRGKNRGRGKVHIQPRSKHERWVLEGIGNLAHTPLCSAINFRHGCSKQTYSLCSISCLRILFYGTTIRSPWIRTIHCAIRMKLHSSLLNVNFNVEHVRRISEMNRKSYCDHYCQVSGFWSMRK